MKIAITIELDKETTELFQVPFKKLSKQINDLIGMFEKVDYVVEDALDLDPNMNTNPKSDPETKSEPETEPILETKKNPKTKTSKSPKHKKSTKTKPQKSVSGIIFKTIKKNKDGINSKDLQEQTGFTGKQISNNMVHLKKDKKVEKTKEGLFVAL